MVMGEKLQEVRAVQSHMTQQVSLMTGCSDWEKEPADLQPDVCERDRPCVEVCLDDGAMVLLDGFGRTNEGKLKCGYCNYTSRGTARLIEHIRIHTGEKPHRCQLCPFASAYERHLESHMRSHTGEKPYKCELCSFRCSDRSNLSHHRRRRHKVLPMRGGHSALANKKVLSAQRKKPGSLSYGQCLLSKRTVEVKLDDGFPNLSLLHTETYESLVKPHSSAAAAVDTPLPVLDNPLDQLSTLAGQLDSLPSQVSHLSASITEKLVPAPHESVPAGVAQPLSAFTPDACELLSPQSGHDALVTSDVGTDRAVPALCAPRGMLYLCPHCETYFADNVLYTIHMGCHGYEKPFQCNVCGRTCQDKYDFACHFARGQHRR